MFEYDINEADGKPFTCLPAGDYEAEILRAETSVSKAGNDMLVVAMCLYGNDGEKVRCIDYIVAGKTIYKLKQICNHLGLDFNGKLDENILEGKSLKVRVKVDKSKDPKYGDRNVVTNYLEGISKTTAPEKSEHDDSAFDLPV